MAEQNRFIEKIKNALVTSSDSKPSRKEVISGILPREYEEALESVRNRKDSEQEALIDILRARTISLNINVQIMLDFKSVRNAIIGLICDRTPEWGDRKGVVAWKHPLIEALELSHELAKLNAPLHFANERGEDQDRHLFRNAAAQALIGVTSADFLVAESATVVIKSRPGQPRSVSLLPTIHVVVIRSTQILKNTRELYALFYADETGLGNSTMLITGPSKTADIEATLVHGAHGPRELHLFILKDRLRSSRKEVMS